MKIEMGGQKVVSLVDSGATHNFVATRDATRFCARMIAS